MHNRISKKYLTIILCFFLHSIGGKAQLLEGKIVDIQGKPIEYVTVYVNETKTGCITSDSGEFILSLKPGNYTCIIQHLNYKTLTKTIEVPHTSVWKIVMEPKAITLKEVKISARAEDKAYRIIRKTVAKSPYYRKQLLSYKATFYAKESMKIKELPTLASKIFEKEMQIEKGDVFTQESVSEVVVKPGKTEQTVISKRSSYPQSLNLSLGQGFVFFNIYSNDSPVSKQGLLDYRYQLEYSYNDNELLIHHIKVIPRNANPYAYSGYVDIIDGSWHVYNFDFTQSMDYGIAKIHYTRKQNYVPIEKNVWMPGGWYAAFDVKVMGYSLDVYMTTSIQYEDCVVNPILKSLKPATEVSSPEVSSSEIPSSDTLSSEELSSEEPLKEPVISKKSEKLSKEITEIMNQEELKTRDAIKLVNLIEAKDKEDLKNNPKNDSVHPLEIQKRFFLTVDSNASNYDSTYWANYRTIPLSEEELKGFEQKQIKDSILEAKKKEKLSLKKETKITKNKNKTFSMGITWANSILAFNTVEGFKAGIHVYADKKFKDSVTTLENGITFGYAFASKHFFLDASSQWNYNPKRFASLEVFGGKQTCDFKQEQQNGKYIVNSISSLFFRDNLIQYYDRTYAGLKHKIELFNGCQTTVGLQYEQRRPLDNRSDYSFFFRKKREYKSNIPDNEYVANNFAYISAQNAFFVDISLSYTPRMYFRYSENKKKKYYMGSKYPTFTLLWRKGINNLLGSNSHFDYLELNIAQEIDFSMFKTFKYNLSAGVFPNTKAIHFTDFKHFQTNNFWVAFNLFHGMFNTLPNYSYSTNKWFVSGHVQYETLYLLLKFIPGLNKTLITENIHLSFLSNPLTKNYTEVGYSLSKIFIFGNIGFFVGFDEFKSVNWSVRVGFAVD